MLIDLTCPAEVFQVTPPPEDKDLAAVSLYNLSDRVIVAAEVTLRLQNERGVDLEKVTFERQGLCGRPHTVFRVDIPCKAHPGTEKETADIEKIRFSDGEEWIRETGGETEYTPNDLPVCKALTDLKFVAGETARGFPEEQEGLWLCVCGRPNPEEAETCTRCRRRKETVFAKYNRDTVETIVSQRERQLDLASRGTREDMARLQHLREAEFRVSEVRRKRRKHLIICLAVFIAIMAALLLWVEPALYSMLPK
jgi:hypothetical protein